MLPRTLNHAKDLLEEPGFPALGLPSSLDLPKETPDQITLYQSWPKEQFYELRRLLDYIRRDLRVDRALPSSSAYVDKVIQPVLDMFNGLLLKDDSPTLFACVEILTGSPPGITVMARHAHDKENNTSDPLTECYCIVLLVVRLYSSDIMLEMTPNYSSPLRLFKPPGTLEPTDWTHGNSTQPFDSTKPPSWRVWATHALRRAKRNRTTHIMLSDPMNTVLLHIEPPETPGDTKVLYSVGNQGETFRACLARLLFYRSTQDDRNRTPVLMSDSGIFLRQGASVDTSLPLPTEEEVRSTRLSFSDFDVYMMQNHYADYPLFVSWKSHIEGLGRNETFGVLKGRSNGFLTSNVPLRSPFAPQNLPSATAQKIRDLMRPRCDALDAALSDSFEIKITRFIQGGPNHWSQAAVGRVVRPSSSGSDAPSDPLPKVFIKLYDERFFSTPPWWDEGSENPLLPIPGPLAYFHPALELVRREEAAYYSLHHAQGSFFPHCYGFHEFTYPSGWKTYGMITELIKGKAMKQTIRKLNTLQVRELTINMRHAIRILRYADIHQTDWSSGQIIVMRYDKTDTIVPVVFDFAFALQSEPTFDVMYKNDWVRGSDILGSNGVPKAILDELWEPEDEIEM